MVIGMMISVILKSKSDKLQCDATSTKVRTRMASTSDQMTQALEKSTPPCCNGKQIVVWQIAVQIAGSEQVLGLLQLALLEGIFLIC